MFNTTPWGLSGGAYMAYAVKYAAWLYHSLQVGDVSMALFPFLQPLTLGGRKPGIAPAGRNICGSASLWVAPLCTAMPSASMPAKANAR